SAVKTAISSGFKPSRIKGNDPTWPGTDHTRERVPVLVHGKRSGRLGHIGFKDVAALVADHLGVTPRKA
ncbi:MAG: hypothetical protein AAGO57_01630, partial [Pseudomonadota bacterium]